MADDVTVKLPFGIAGDGLREVERTIPAGEPPPLPPNDRLSVIGKPTPRLDGRLKVTGAARYTSDVRLPGMLFARIVRSTLPHARIRAIDTSAAEQAPGVHAVQVVDHLIGGAELRDPKQEMPSSFPVVRYVGQPILAVAAVSQAAADDAARLVRIEYEPLPFVVDLEEARKPGAPLVFPAAADQAGSAGGGGGPSNVPQVGNVRGPARSGPHGSHGIGDVERGLSEAEVVVDATYRTQVQTHSAMEAHGLVADWGAEGLTVYASTQGTSTVRDELSEVLDLPKAKIRVVTEFMGGGFGAKFGAGNYGILAARLSKKAGAPVRVILDRREEHESVGNRPSSVARIRIGAKKDGTLTAIHFASYGTAGTGTGAGAGGPAKNLYPCPNVLVEESDVFTNAGPAAAFRAPGHPQGAFGLEQSIDELAEKLGMDPLALRDRIDVDDPGEEGGSAGARRVERRIGAELVEWRRRRPPGIRPWTGQARHRRRAGHLVPLREPRLGVRGPHRPRRFGRGAERRAGHRRRDPYRPRPGGGRGAGDPPAGRRRPHRRHDVPAGASIGRKRDDRLTVPGGSHRSLQGEAGDAGAGARRVAGGRIPQDRDSHARRAGQRAGRARG